jgi:hypothetical protein
LFNKSKTFKKLVLSHQHNSQNKLFPTLGYDVGMPQRSILFSFNDVPSVCTGSEVPMYADDTVIYVHAKSKQQASQEFTTVMVQVTKWLRDSCLHLNVKQKQKQSACSSQRGQLMPLSQMSVSGEKLQVVDYFKYHVIILDSNLYFKKANEKGNSNNQIQPS